MNKKALFFTLLFVMICVFSFSLNVSADFKDDFSDTNYPANGWNLSTLWGKTDIEYAIPGRKHLTFNLPNYNTALYFINENTNAADSTVEATFENVFSYNSSYGLVCRYHSYGWYELRVVAAGPGVGSYTIYKYDESLRAEKKNPYVNLTPDMERYYTFDINVGKGSVNTLKMSCEEDEIRIFINGKEQFPVKYGKLRDSDFTDGESGIMFYTEKPNGQAQFNLTSFKAVFENK